MLDVRQVIERRALLDLLNHRLDLLAKRFPANFLQVFGETPAEDDLHGYASSRSKISSRLTISVVAPSLIDCTRAISSRASATNVENHSRRCSSTSTKASLSNALRRVSSESVTAMWSSIKPAAVSSRAIALEF